MKLLILLLILINIIIGTYGMVYKTKDTCDDYRQYLTFLVSDSYNFHQDVSISSNSTLYKEINGVPPNIKLCEDNFVSDDPKVTCYSQEKINNTDDSYLVNCEIIYPNPNGKTTSKFFYYFIGFIILVLIITIIVLIVVKIKKRNKKNDNNNLLPTSSNDINNNDNNDNNNNNENTNENNDNNNNNNNNDLPSYTPIDINNNYDNDDNDNTNTNTNYHLPTYKETVAQ